MGWDLGVDVPMSFETRVRAHEYAERVDVPVVRSSDEAWEALANASEDFATALESSRREIDLAVRSNVFGDCIEGHAVHSRVEEVLRAGATSISGQITNQRNYLVEHAAMCRAASDCFTETDHL